MTLWETKPNQLVKIVDIDQEAIILLHRMGFGLNSIVECTNAPDFGAPRLYRVLNTTWALESAVADLIEVVPVRPES